MLTLFIVSSFEGWPDIMYQAVDGTTVAEVNLPIYLQGPVKNGSPLSAYYFVSFILIGSFFFLNFFIGVLFLNFKAAQKEETDGKAWWI